MNTFTIHTPLGNLVFELNTLLMGVWVATGLSPSENDDGPLLLVLLLLLWACK